MADGWRGRILRRLGFGNDDAVRALTAAVRDLAKVQRAQTAELKKLLDAQKAQERRWQEAFSKVQHDSAKVDAKVHKTWQETIETLQRRWQKDVEALLKSDRNRRKWLGIFVRQMEAMMRTTQLSRSPLVSPTDLLTRRFRLFSQNEEDGVVLALFEHAGVTNRRFVEVGSGLSGGNSALLAYECGWSGLMIDIDPRKIDRLRQDFRHNPGVIGIAVAVSPENINPILREHGFTGEIDFLSLDIDSFDYWVLEALTAVSPRVLVVEYNARLGPERAVTIARDGVLEEVPKSLRGASLAAIEKLARRKGYRLVFCEPTGTNAFFLRNDVAPEFEGLSAEAAYRPSVDRSSMEAVPAVAHRAPIENEGRWLVEV